MQKIPKNDIIKKKVIQKKNIYIYIYYIINIYD